MLMILEFLKENLFLKNKKLPFESFTIEIIWLDIELRIRVHVIK